MKTPTAIFFALLFLTFAAVVVVPAGAQDTMNHDDGQKTYASQKPVTLRGTISNTGETFVADGDSKSWTIVNPDDIKGHEGQHVVLTANVDADKKEVHVVSVRVAGK